MEGIKKIIMDTTSPILLNQLHPLLRTNGILAWQEACEETPENEHPAVNQVLRTFAQSTYDYNLGRTIINPDGRSAAKPMGNIISDAKAGESYHNYGLALDIDMIINDQHWNDPTPKVIAIFAKYGFSSGLNFPGKFKDAPHFENRLGYNWRQLLAKYNAGDFIPDTNYVKI
jgi:peptidoglycan L-alanyl-D-glutamate endopeptidase CwlK